MSKNNTYVSEKNSRYTLKTREILAELPQFCAAFFRSIENRTSVLTRYAYAVDLRTFFTYMGDSGNRFYGQDLPTLPVTALAEVKREDIEAFLADMSLYSKEDREITNDERAKARKLSALRAFFKYYFKKEILPSNVAALVDTPKLHQKAIIRLEPNEVANLLDIAESAEGLTARQKKYQLHTRTRDVAILSLFLGTGIRISELIGLDIDDVDFDSNAFVVTRKGGSQDILSFGNEVRMALLAYVAWRTEQVTAQGHENALFLSLQMKRVSVRCVEYLVKKYASVAAPLKKISPHKLRSTFGTILYHESHDIYLVADVLGHKDVNTTRKHYAAVAEDNKRVAAKLIKLRDD